MIASAATGINIAAQPSPAATAARQNALIAVELDSFGGTTNARCSSAAAWIRQREGRLGVEPLESLGEATGQPRR